ncbi:conjugative transposon protein TraK [Hoylesella timonensis]|jgi:conjugative transposon TraK protein|uniref:Conjugative transposon protein TraK n=1 Tax=Hoylesella timonensis TaxID=386414 RepID=A0A2K0XHU5_9BACT|nr:conjugative transposon protein TraK [Hoylesella timonensis]PNP94095.1 conjugative transposon protein TraK [Hoylesella timonensis]
MAVLKKLENKIKLVLIVTSLFLIGCIVISLGSLFIARGMVADAHKKIYVLDGTVPVLVKQTTMDETFGVEAKSHVEMFHNLFFTLAPDDKYIDYTIKKAMYLIDESGLAQYNALKEKGFYNNIIGTSTICSIFCDSIKLDEKKLTFTYYGRQRIERRTSILMRQLITAGSLRRVPRTENNPHGFIIYGWRTLVNKDLSENQKTNY